MNKQTQKRICDIIRSDASTRGKLIEDDDETTCVLGGLALAAGVSKEDLKKYQCRKNYGISSLHELARKLQKEYELSFDQLYQLQTCNDNHFDVQARRQELIELVKSWSEPEKSK